MASSGWVWARTPHWGFSPRLCQPYRAQTKGKVESGVKYVKRNFVPGRVFRDLDDFNEQLAAWQAEIADLREHGTTHQRPIAIICIAFWTDQDAKASSTDC